MTDFTPPSTEEALGRLGMPMADAMRTQRAVRRLHTVPVDMDLIYELLDLSLKAPTSSNTQDWTYMVLTGREQKERLHKLYRPLYRTFSPLERRAAKKAGDDKALRQMEPGRWQAEHFADIPVFVIPCYERNLKHHAVGWPQISVSSFYGSVYPAVQNLLLVVPRRRARRVAADAADLDLADRPAHPRPAPQQGAGVRHPDRLGEGQLRPDDTTADPRGRPHRPLRQPARPLASPRAR